MSHRPITAPLFLLWLGFAVTGLSASSRPLLAASVVFTGTSVVFSGSGLAPDNGDFLPVSARATFTIEPGSILQLVLENLSPEPTPAPAALLSSFYFAVGSGTNVPSLSYDVAEGQVYQLSTTAPPLAGTFTPPSTFAPGTGLSDLRAFNTGDRTWEFLDGLSLVASSPPLTFGIGTVGNSDLEPNNFDGNIVDGKDFSIFVGSPQTANLAGELLVKDSITFQFGGLGSFTLDDIVPHAVFGFGTSPYVVAVPEPAGAGLLALETMLGGLALLAARRARGGLGDWRCPDGGRRGIHAPGGLFFRWPSRVRSLE